MDLFFQIHQGLPREAPGSDADTRRAIAMLPAMKDPRVLDIGCGPGGQTLELARQTGGTIIALDTHQPFLDELNARAQRAGMTEKIRTLNRSMFEMDFEPCSFDLLWAEGSVYIYGLTKALKDWSILLHRGGCIGITEAVWLKENPPQEVFEFWQNAYPEMRYLSEILTLIPTLGYELLGHFVLSESSWWESYYNPMLARIEQLRSQYANDTVRLMFISATPIGMAMPSSSCRKAHPRCDKLHKACSPVGIARSMITTHSGKSHIIRGTESHSYGL